MAQLKRESSADPELHAIHVSLLTVRRCGRDVRTLVQSKDADFLKILADIRLIEERDRDLLNNIPDIPISPFTNTHPHG
jgi:hypothetical protein